MNDRFRKYFVSISCSSKAHLYHNALGRLLDDLADQVDLYLSEQKPRIDKKMVERLEKRCILPTAIATRTIMQITHDGNLNTEDILHNIDIEKLLLAKDHFPFLRSLYDNVFMYHDNSVEKLAHFIREHCFCIIKWDLIKADRILQDIRHDYLFKISHLAKRHRQQMNLNRYSSIASVSSL